MRQIAFKQKYLPDVKSGKKTQTIRAWKRCTLEEGDVVEATFGSWDNPSIIMVVIDYVEQLTFEDLDEEAVKADGYDSPDVLLKDLQSFYGPDVVHRPLWVIGFSPL